MKKLWTFLLSMLLVLSLAACDGAPKGTVTTAPEETEPEFITASWKEHTEPVTLTVVSQLTEGKNPPFDPPAWGEDAVSREIMNLTGVKLDMKAQGLMAPPDVKALAGSGGLDVDLIAVSKAADAQYLETSGLAAALDTLAETACPDFWNTMDPVRKLNNTAADGHIYTVRTGYWDEAMYSDERLALFPAWTLNFNEKLLKGQAMPTSVEELETLLASAGSGTVPLAMTGVTDSPLPGWMGIHRDLYWDEETKTVRSPLRQPAWQDYLTLMNRWVRSGWVSLPKGDEADPLTGSADWAAAQMSRTLVYTASINDNRSGDLYASTVSSDDPWPWQMLTSPLTYKGEQRAAADNIRADGFAKLTGSALSNSDGRRTSALFIGSSAANPERALYFMQFLLSDEGGELTHWGLSEKHYTADKDGLLTYTESFRNAPDDRMDSGTPGHSLFNEDGIAYWFLAGNDKAAAVLDASPEAYLTNGTALAMRAQLIEAGKAYKAEVRGHACPVLQFALPEAGSLDEGTYRELTQAWNTEVEAIIRQSKSEAEVSQRWSALVSDMGNRGLDRLEQAMTERFSEALVRYHEAGYYTDIQP